MEPILQHFTTDYDHTTEPEQQLSASFRELADKVMKLPRNPERTVALRKLLEARDATMRATIHKDP